jgi:hypothetical protein
VEGFVTVWQWEGICDFFLLACCMQQGAKQLGLIVDGCSE